jgi:transposase
MRGDLTIVHVPDEEDESIRDLIRSRGFLVKENRQIKTHILSLCRRIGLDYRKEHGVRSNYWTELHRIWLQKQIKGLRQRAHQINMAHLLMTLHQIEQTIDLYDQEILELSKQSKYQKPMEALRCFRSIGTLTAMTITTELGDIRRFNHPEKLTSYAGLDLREYSSGGKEKKFGITHLGNKYLRTAVVEASQLAAYRPSISRDLKRRREGASAKSIEIADRCMKRLYKRSDHLLRRGKHPNKVKVAAARELLSFIWEALRAAA